MSENCAGLSRRTFVKGAGALGALAAAGGALSASNALVNEVTPALAETSDEIHWGMCNVNCGGSCVFQWHCADGKIKYMETDNVGPDDLQARACLRGRAMRKWINSPDRLLYPMKRVEGAKRGEGKFEQITWEEAIQLIHDKLEYAYDFGGPNAVYLNYGTGMYANTGRPVGRMLTSLGKGGYVNQGYDYSTNMMSAAMPYMYGFDAEKGSVFSPYDAYNASSFSEAELHSDLLVLIGNSPAETRMGGANAVWDFARAREAILARGGKVIHIDYRLNETISGTGDQWIPIRTGTDGALVAAIAHEWIVNNQIDKKFLDKYTVGFDEDTMPKSAKGKNKSYKAYIMGKGYDKVEKTPEWAAPITQIPADVIRELADTIAKAKAPFITQGWGPQRHSNGEEASRAICLLQILIGKIGLPGTNTGQREAEPPIYLTGGIPDANPNPTTLPVYQWLNAVDHGEDMTATNAGIMGADKLGTSLKFVMEYAGNCITNQHGDINKVYEVLNNENTQDLFLVVWDTVMTDSAKYADLLLPDAMRCEQLNMYTQGYSEYYTAVKVGTPAQEAPGECRSSYDVCADIAESFGKRDEFTEGRTHDEWVQYLYENNYSSFYGIKVPSWDEILEQGLFKQELPPAIGFDKFRDDPEANPLGTPSGKIEIYSETLDNLNKSWELEEGDEIYPIPLFNPGFQGYGSVTDEYPLYCSGFHHKSRTHSSFGFIQELDEAASQRLWINPIDAKSRGISMDDVVSVKSPAGEIRIPAFVTNRIIPGTVCVPQGAWHSANMSGNQVDEGGCVNTLTTYRPTPLGKGNGPSNSIIVQVSKA